jgi:penicillin-binding protein 1A
MTQMTGGSLPAMTWREIMLFAHQGIELKPIPGLPPPAARTIVAEQRKDGSEVGRPSSLTRRGAEALVRLERLMDEATRALAAQSVPSRAGLQGGPTAAQQGTLASASGEGATGQNQGN